MIRRSNGGIYLQPQLDLRDPKPDEAGRAEEECPDRRRRDGVDYAPERRNVADFGCVGRGESVAAREHRGVLAHYLKRLFLAEGDHQRIIRLYEELRRRVQWCDDQGLQLGSEATKREETLRLESSSSRFGAQPGAPSLGTHTGQPAYSTVSQCLRGCDLRPLQRPLRPPHLVTPSASGETPVVSEQLVESIGRQRSRRPPTAGAPRAAPS